MTKPLYDPAKAHDYYEKHKQLKGRQSAAVDSTLKRLGGAKLASNFSRKPVAPNDAKKRAQARVVRLVAKVHSLNNALKETEDALRAKQKEAKKNSDGKTTVKERSAAKQYRDTHKSKIAAEAKKAADKSGGSSTPSGSKKVSEMSETELTDRISKIKGLISVAKKQIQSANSLAHSSNSFDFISHSGPTAVNTN